MSDQKNMLSGAYWITISTLFNIVNKVIILVILSRLLSPAEFGIVAAIQIIINFSEIFSMMGVGPALVQKKYIESHDISTGFYLNLIFGSLIVLLIMLFSNLLSTNLNINNNKIILTISIIFLIKSISGASESLLQREFAFKIIGLNSIIATICYSTIAITLAYFQFGAWSLIIAQLFQVTINSLLSVYRRKINIFIKPSIKSAKQLTKYGLGFTISRLFNTMANEGDNIIVSKTLGVTALGNYSRAYQILMVPTLILGTIIEKVFFPLLSQYQDDNAKLRAIYLNITNFIIVISIPLIFLTLPLANEIIYLILGDQWLNITFAFQILFCSLFFRISYKMCDTLTYSLGKVYKRVWTQVIYAVSIVIGALYSNKFGIEGVALSTTIAIIINYIIMHYMVSKLISLNQKTFILNLFPNLVINLIYGGFLLIICMFLNSTSYVGTVSIMLLIFLITYSLYFKYIILKYSNSEFINFIKKTLNLLFSRVRSKKIIN